MRKGGECVVVGVKEEIYGDQRLQKMFEEMGGGGRVTDFLNRVVVDGWDGLSRGEQVIWLRLHDTRRIGYRVEDRVDELGVLGTTIDAGTGMKDLIGKVQSDKIGG